MVEVLINQFAFLRGLKLFGLFGEERRGEKTVGDGSSSPFFYKKKKKLHAIVYLLLFYKEN